MHLGHEPRRPHAGCSRRASDSTDDTWWSTVFGEMNRRAAISSLVRCSTRQAATSISRAVRPAGFAFVRGSNRARKVLDPEPRSLLHDHDLTRPCPDLIEDREGTPQIVLVLAVAEHVCLLVHAPLLPPDLGPRGCSPPRATVDGVQTRACPTRRCRRIARAGAASSPVSHHSPGPESASRPALRRHRGHMTTQPGGLGTSSPGGAEHAEGSRDRSATANASSRSTRLPPIRLDERRSGPAPRTAPPLVRPRCRGAGASPGSPRRPRSNAPRKAARRRRGTRAREPCARGPGCSQTAARPRARSAHSSVSRVVNAPCPMRLNQRRAIASSSPSA